MSMLRHRALGGNRFSGSMPSTISALTALTFMYVPKFLSMWRLPRCASAWALRSVRPHPPLCVIRYLNNNSFTGPILGSITALTRLADLYAAPPPVRSGRLARANEHVAAQGPRR
jgi:hypothetical protein